MSRCFKIYVSESLQVLVHVDDGLQTQLELLPILPTEQMQGLLAARLEEKGYEPAEDGVWKKVFEGGVSVEVEVETGKVSITLTEDAELDLHRTVSKTAIDEAVSTVRENLRTEAKHQLKKQVASLTNALQIEVTRKLETALPEIQTELNDAVNRATADALKVKAGQLGEVTEISEDPETGAVTIRIQVR